MEFGDVARFVRRSRGENMYGLDQFMQSTLLQQEREAEELSFAEAQAEHDQHEFDQRVKRVTMLMKQFVKSEGHMVSKRALLKRFLESPNLGDCIAERQVVFDAAFATMLKANIECMSTIAQMLSILAVDMPGGARQKLPRNVVASRHSRKTDTGVGG